MNAAPAPLPDSRVMVPCTITKAFSTEKVSIQFDCHKDSYVRFVNEMRMYYDKKDLKTINTCKPDDGQLYLLKRDDVFYRAQITSNLGSGKYAIYLIDEGFHYHANEEELVVNDNMKFTTFPKQGFEYALQFDGQMYNELKYVINYALQKITNFYNEFYLTFAQNSDKIYLFCKGESGKIISINDSLCELSQQLEYEFNESQVDNMLMKIMGSEVSLCNGGDVPVRPPISAPIRSNGTGPQVIKTKGKLDLPVHDWNSESSEIEMRCKHVVSPSEFYLQFPKLDEYSDLKDEMQKYYADSGNHKKPAKIELNKAYAIVYNDKWTRVMLLDTCDSDDFFTCFLLDKGLVGYVSDEEIFELDDQFKKIPSRAVSATLAYIRPSENEWSEAAIEFFRQQVEGQIVEVVPLDLKEDSHILRCNLMVDDNNLLEIIMTEGYGEPTD